MPRRRAVLMIRHAISPRLAIKIRLNINRTRPLRPRTLCGAGTKKSNLSGVDRARFRRRDGAVSLCSKIEQRGERAGHRDGADAGADQKGRDGVERAAATSIAPY